ncbi:MarR family winged helix-turn-helix transcriptional regulator [Phytoactinopolyspora mesophila]|uniref:MarR family transcriptional regulator n=1 Tax=Phytoactinopolyspora mesophila TaxID=2650750 RepID=A0A7K3LY84_9ACTN|nr:MarR family transcriptional regulator [Phytoactinopolyspora mesophila]NDL55777.1 MarR family transcriptional regulator [Phytoactinopolyspora mesophila]
MTTDAVAKIVEQWEREMPELDLRPMLVVGRIHRLAEMMDVALRPPFRDAGLGNGEFDILAALRRAGQPYSRTPRDLGSALMVTSGAITKQIDRLEAKGLVIREADPRDARSRMITLTDKGADLVERLLPEHLANERALLTTLSAEQQEQLASLLLSLAARLEGREG